MAVAVAPWIGLYVFDHGGWTLMCFEAAALNLIMAIIAWRLPKDVTHADAARRALHFRNLIEWRSDRRRHHIVLVFVQLWRHHELRRRLCGTLGVTPRAMYFTVVSLAILSTRPFIGRYADRVGHSRIIVPCLVMVLGVSLLPIADSRPMFVVSALLFGVGFGSVYPLLVALLMHKMPEHRRGATFGALIGAFDTGIGTGSIAIGWMSERYGFSRAFTVAAILAAMSVPLPVYGEAQMDYVRLGSTGLRVSRLCLGTMTYGTPAWRPWVLDEAASRPFIKRALEHGINFFDTANMLARCERGRGPRPQGLRDARQGRGRDESVLPGRRGRQRRPVSQANYVGDRCFAAPVGYGLRRSLSDPPLRQSDADRRDAGSAA